MIRRLLAAGIVAALLVLPLRAWQDARSNAPRDDVAVAEASAVIPSLGTGALGTAGSSGDIRAADPAAADAQLAQSAPDDGSVQPGEGGTAAYTVPSDLVTTYPGGSTVYERQFFSPILDRQMTYRVLLPPEYDDSAVAYPVLYMLHGVAGGPSEWQEIGLLEAADKLIAEGVVTPMIVALPDGGANYWVNHADGARWADYVAQDVVNAIDTTYRTRPVPSARAIGGLSMGGEGALRLAMQHPDIFGIAAAHSPSLRTSYDELTPELKDLYGDEAAWLAGSPFGLIDTPGAHQVTIELDVGQDDPWRPNVELLHQKMIEQGIEHELDVLPGGHDADYWIAYVDRYLNFYDAAFAGRAPSSVASRGQ
ncbi:MAG: esterase family protein [Chloroflexi bacterium]|nr:esterase family protein [Chloroflexota bacterium]